MAGRDHRDRSADRYRGLPRDSTDDFRRNGGREPDNFVPRSHTNTTNDASGSDGGKGVPGFQLLMELFGEMSTAYGELTKAEARLSRTKRDHNISASRPTEFASLGYLKHQELQRGEEEIVRLRRKLVLLYPKLQTGLDSYVRASVNPVTQPDTPTSIWNQPDLEKRLSELQRSINTLGESRLQAEITALREVFDEEKEKNKIMAKELEAQKKKSQSLEENINQLDRMIRAIKPTVELQVSSELDKQIRPRMTSLEDNLNEGLSNNVEVTKQLQILVDGHTEQLANLANKRSDNLVAGPSSATVAQTAEPSVTAQLVRLEEDLQIRGRNIDFMMKNKMEPALSKIRDIEKSVEQSMHDSKFAKSFIQVQATHMQTQTQQKLSIFESTARDQAKKLEENFSTLETTTRNQTKKLEENFSTLESAARDQANKHSSLNATVTRLNSELQLALKQQQKKTDDLGQKLASASSASTVQASELSSLQSSLKKQQKKSDSLEKTVASLETKIQYQPPQGFEKLAAKMQEYPPAADLNRILADFPSSKDLKMLIADTPKLKESVSKLKACKTPPPPPSLPNPNSLMTEETITQTVNYKIKQLDIATMKEIRQVFESFAKDIDNRQGLTANSITSLNDRMLKVNKGLEESKQQAKMVKEVGESLQKRCNEQTTELKREFGAFVENFNNLQAGTRRELEDVQFRMTSVHDRVINLNTKNWFDNMAQHIQNHMPNHFGGQLNSLEIRVSNLEDHCNGPEIANKRRRIANGSGNALARNGTL
ncbi:unnamed protein product [Fusarium graminearum]|uniref:Chromosome 3, complete genome n=3 Tax=Gibberella zeae TaxID=5518 RepID=A0A0E0SPG1_GIBZE|nr:hypothetical protein FG05_06259 [Fusarium graminearum]KAI6751486.1 hypothetical protein HG531_006182 [Fusarium graminearum]PCD19148.1 hypothetical protein FGRA07_05953 [Fusarium graminearum]CAF3492004.1 unnamed protein product [Fusarium graminearum]CAF3554611.1 unnamed protein product [Fusarium graminearum]